LILLTDLISICHKHLKKINGPRETPVHIGYQFVGIKYWETYYGKRIRP